MRTDHHCARYPAQLRRLTPKGEHYFFGYYDVPAFSHDEMYHLYHHVAFADRLPNPGDKAELGILDLHRGEHRKLAETDAWNFQQGAMLQFHPREASCVLFNERRRDDFGSVVLDVESGARVHLPRPIACVDPKGCYALSINFSRLASFRPGYGYQGVPDPFNDILAPQADGVYRMVLSSGASELILSLSDLWSFCSEGSRELLPSPDCDDRELREPQKVLINHITYNSNGTRFILLLRFKSCRGWKTAAVTVSAQGDDLHLLSPFAYASHYSWLDDRYVVLHADVPHLSSCGPQLYLLEDLSDSVRVVDSTFFKEDGHCNFSPDGQHLLYDSYPFTDRLRHLYLYSLKHRTGGELGAFESNFDEIWDGRCDLHARWSPGGRQISLDSSHEGYRAIYHLPVLPTQW